MEKIRELSYLEILWDEESKSQITTWLGGFKGRDIREGLDIALEEFEKRPEGSQWVGDTRDIGVISQEDQDWINKDWFPRFLATGVKYMAVVVPNSTIAKMSVDAIVSKVEGTNLTSKYVSTIEEAVEWIKENNK